MRNRIRMLPVVALLMACACAGRGGPVTAREPVTPPTPAEVGDQARAVLESWRQAQEVRSLEALDPLYLTNADLVIVGQGRASRGWQAARERIAAFFGETKKNRMQLGDVRVMALGEGGALVHAAVHRTYGDDVSTVDEQGEVTLVLRRIDETWKIVAEHYSYAGVTE